jgi:FtsP/CotA-like multicopper oxidase with cupredoxin domain
MHTNTWGLPQRLLNTRRWLIALLAALAVALSLSATAHAAPPPLASCDPGTTTTLQCELWARAGTFIPPGGGSPLTVWGYVQDNDTTPSVVTQPGGPTITVNQGDTVEIILHNDLAEATSLALHGQGLPADTVGAASAGSTTYTFTASQAGTFLYEAGLTANSARQVAMGLYGVLIVQPAIPATYETVLLLSEIDPALNANPTGFNMLDYAPKYWLINGESHPDTDFVQAPAGATLLVRYVNASLTEHSMGLLGLDQTVIAKDGHARPAFRAVSETLAAGQTMDTLIVMPNTVGARYPLYDTGRRLDNNGAANGGMMTFVEVAPDLPPTVSIVNPIEAATVSGMVIIDAAAGDDIGITQVEFFVDSISVGADTNGGDGWSVSWDTTTATNASHSLTAVATDTAAQTTTSAAVNVTVSNAPPPGNTPPTVSISAPADGSSFTAGDLVTFTGTGSDAEDGDVSASLAWTSSLDGTIGAGGTFSTSTLTVGMHTITATATDSGTLTGSASITVTITP